MSHICSSLLQPFSPDGCSVVPILFLNRPLSPLAWLASGSLWTSHSEEQRCLIVHEQQVNTQAQKPRAGHTLRGHPF